jgi:hypothetical protein
MEHCQPPLSSTFHIHQEWVEAGNSWYLSSPNLHRVNFEAPLWTSFFLNLLKFEVQIEESIVIQEEFCVMIHSTPVEEITNARIELPSHKVQSTTQQKVTLKWKTPKSKLFSLNNSAETQIN